MLPYASWDPGEFGYVHIDGSSSPIFRFGDYLASTKYPQRCSKTTVFGDATDLLTMDKTFIHSNN